MPRASTLREPCVMAATFLLFVAACGSRSGLEVGTATPTEWIADAAGGNAATDGASGSGGADASTDAGIAGYVSVACGGEHVCAATAAGEVVCWGYGGRGQLGDGAATPFTKDPIAAKGLHGATAVAAGGEHTCALAGGIVFCFGHDEYGQVGDGSSGIGVDRPLPVAVPLPESASAIVAGGPHFGAGHSCALGVSGAVYCWGANAGGQIGDGDSGFGALVATPFRVSALPAPASALAAGGNHTCALVVGDVWCWGYDGNGQIGNGASGANLAVPTPTKVVGLPAAATAVAAGDAQSCAVLADGQVWCWGEAGFGELGITVPSQASPSPIASFPGSPVVAIDMGAMHGCVVRAGGSVECAGLDDLGEVGSGAPGPFEIHATPVNVGVGDAVAITTGTTTTCALRSGGKVTCWGDWFGSKPVELP